MSINLATYSFSDIVAIIAESGAPESSECLYDIADHALACHHTGEAEPYADIQDRVATAYNFGVSLAPVVRASEEVFS